MVKTYDAIVLGAGGAGSAAMWRLARRGASVLGVDRFAPPHALGSSHGQTRIIRQAYFEHPDYVPLLHRTYQLWAELEEITGERLFERTGLIEVGPAGGVVVPGVLRAAREHGLKVEELTPAELMRRWPELRVRDDEIAVHEPTAGYLRVERCVAACLAQAKKAGAELLCDTIVNGWRGEGNGLVVETGQGAFACDRLIITAGAWAGGLLAELGIKLRLRRMSLFWFEAPAGEGYRRLPPYLFEDAGGAAYGFPALPPWGMKIADHSRGQDLAHPEQIDRAPDPDEERRLRRFLAERLPAVTGAVTHHAACYYTLSPDEHFIVDRLPSDPRVSLAAGLSGHGFKFTPVLGEALADLALDGATDLPIGFLSASRFACP